MSAKDYWTFERIKTMLNQIMDELGIDHLPTHTELMQYGIYSTTLKPYGGLSNISILIDVPLAPRQGRTTGTPKRKKDKSGLVQKEAEARAKGMHYADLQKAETLRMVGSIL